MRSFLRFEAILWMLAGAAAVAQTLPPRPINLIVGRGELLQFERDLQRVAVSEPKIADAIVVSPREVMVNAKGAGKATLVVWVQEGLPARFDVNVAQDKTALEDAHKNLRAKLGDQISLVGSDETIVLYGSVKTEEEAKRAEGLAATGAKRVINLIRTEPPPDPRQILLQVRFASVNRNNLAEIGFNYFSRNPKLLGGVSTQQFPSPRFSQLEFQDQNFQNSSVNFSDLLNIFIFRPDLNIGATLKALQSRNLLQILAEPNLITLEGKEASFLAGGSFPFPTLQATPTGGSIAPVITVQFKPFGVQLNFTPTVTASGAIHLKVAPEVSALDFSNALTIQGFLIPALSQRKAETEVLLKDGESFAIAGLIDNRVLQTLERVRGLGDLPIIGQLFRSRSVRKSNDELLVVVTPRFVKPLPPGEEVKLPDIQESYLPTIQQERDKKNKKNPPKNPPPQSPAFVGATGHQAPATK